ncbi:MAG: hypothetical protein C4342_06640 [Armatimonadota bacterium]
MAPHEPQLVKCRHSHQSALLQLGGEFLEQASQRLSFVGAFFFPEPIKLQPDAPVDQYTQCILDLGPPAPCCHVRLNAPFPSIRETVWLADKHDAHVGLWFQSDLPIAQLCTRILREQGS